MGGVENGGDGTRMEGLLYIRDAGFNRLSVHMIRAYSKQRQN